MKLSTEKPMDYIRKVVDSRRNIFDRIVTKDPDQILLKASLKDVKKAVVILAASRSGSSLLFSILKRIPEVYSLSGESVPFYKLNGLSSDSFPSDEIPKEMIGKEDYRIDLSRDFLSDFSLPKSQDSILESKNMLDRYIDDLALRFPLQWPGVSFSYEIFMRLAHQAYETYVKTRKGFCKEEFYLELLRLLRQEYSTINPYYYDIPPGMIRKRFPEIKVPSGPPCDILTIEEPPFILLPPGRKVGKEDLADKILLLKSSVDCYRMPFIETLLPRADIKIIYLTRNPAASINGLYDGWLHRGFFSHNLRHFLKSRNSGLRALKISGYSDRNEWGKWWWNYDLPAGWQDYAQKGLAEVCAFQWYSANNVIGEYLEKSRKKYCRIKFENVSRSLASRIEEIGRVVDFMGLRRNVLKQLRLNKLSVVQATQAPQLYRWKKRKDMLWPLLDDPEILDMSYQLAYDKDDIEGWF